MRRILLALVIFICNLTSISFAADQTHSTLPQQNSSFMSDLSLFLQREDAQRYIEHFVGMVVSGGVDATGGTLTHTPTSLTAYPGGYYIVPNTDPKTAKEQPIKIIYEGASEATSGQCDAIAEASTKAAVGAGHVKTEEGRNLRLFLRSHGNSAHDLTMLVNSGIITANEARTLAGIGPINNPS